MCVRQLEEGRCDVENQYTRSVRREGNIEAQRLIREVFDVVPRCWRGIGEIAAIQRFPIELHRRADGLIRGRVCRYRRSAPAEVGL
jgi:hydrogenase expression/formation protein HypD